MALFEALPGEEKEFASGFINAAHEWGLPGVICPRCGNTWTNVGLAYPLVNFAGLPFEKDYRTPRAVPLKEFNSLKHRLGLVLPPGTLLMPGTEFGSLVGRASGKFGDFAWLNPWTPLIMRSAYLLLQEAGIKLPLYADHKLTFRGRADDSLVELQVEPLASLTPDSNASSNGPPCNECGYRSLQLADLFHVERSSIPNHTDFFRARDFTTLIFVTEDFVNRINELGLSGIGFRKLAVSI